MFPVDLTSFKRHQKDPIPQSSLSSRANASVFKNCNFNLGDSKLREIHNAVCTFSDIINNLLLLHTQGYTSYVKVYYQNHIATLIIILCGK